MAQDNGDNISGSSHIPYALWLEEAQRSVVGRALSHVAKNGLQGDHYFYITFLTNVAGVAIPEFLKKRYPETMTIVLQHQFSNLALISIPQEAFTVTLTFSGIETKLVVPLKAIIAFADPGAHLELQFLSSVAEQMHPEEPEDRPQNLGASTLPFPGSFMREHIAEEKREALKDKTEVDDKKPASIISLDRFRKNNKNTSDDD